MNIHMVSMCQDQHSIVKFAVFPPQNACIQHALDSLILNRIACRLLRLSDMDLHYKLNILTRGCPKNIHFFIENLL